MRIHGATQNDVARIGQKDPDAKTNPKAAKAIEGSKADVVTLGSSAKRLSNDTSISAKSGMDPAIQARLEEVREQIKNNEYAIDYKKLATTILGDEVARAGDAE